jgi:hypothetical protein
MATKKQGDTVRIIGGNYRRVSWGLGKRSEDRRPIELAKGAEPRPKKSRFPSLSFGHHHSEPKPFRLKEPRCQCGVCGCDFTRTECFDRHRAGKHGHLFSADRPDGRRRLPVSEMLALGWLKGSDGRWFDPVRSSRSDPRAGDTSIHSV